MLDFLGKSRDQSVADLIARKNYARAIEVLREALQRRRNDPRLRVQLADVLVQSGKTDNGLAMLIEVADDLVLGGETAQAIAVLKRIQSLDPGRADIEEKLAYMIAQQQRPTPDPWRRARRAIAKAGGGRAAAPVRVVTPPPRAFPGDLEEVGEPLPGLEAPPDSETPDEAALDAPAAAATPATAVGPDAPGEEPPPETAPAEVDDVLRNELLALIEDVFVPGEGERPGLVAGEATAAPAGVLGTPLFEGFTAEELVDVIRGLRLRRFEAGEVIVTEGEAGASLFVLTTGIVRAYVRNAAGRNVRVRDLTEGDFFGEVSLLRGVGRTATITAATRAELLEIDRETLNGISQRHPRVWFVLKDFYDRRSGSTLEASARASEPAPQR